MEAKLRKLAERMQPSTHATVIADARPSRAVLLPLRCIEDSLRAHPMITRGGETVQRLYGAMLTLLGTSNLHIDERAPALADDVRRCELCASVATNVADDGEGHHCGVCGHFSTASVACENPYRRFEDRPDRSHWQSARQLFAPTAEQTGTVHELATFTPSLRDEDIGQAAEMVAAFAQQHHVRSLRTMSAAALLIVENATVVQTQRLEARPAPTPPVPRFACTACGTLQFRRGIAQRCCGRAPYRRRA